MKRILVPGVLATLAAALVIARVLTTPGPRPEPTYPDFQVKTASGALALSDLRPQVVVVTFGYTACPDICPTTLARLGAAFRALPARLAERATAVFVSVDPARDTPARLAEYTGYFHPRFIGGALPPDELERVAEAWGVVYQKNEGGSAMGYTMDHSTQAFLLSPEGEVLEHIPHGARPEVIAEKLRAALAR
jgi:protein SCO1/2